MSAIIWLIDQVLIHRGKKTLKGLAKACEDPRKSNEDLLMRILTRLVVPWHERLGD